MQCLNCLGQFKLIKGNLERSDKVLGDFIVPDTEWDECNKCGKILYSPVTMRDIERAEAQRKEELLLDKPLKDFILGTEVAKILGCTRQAVHKQKRIRRGFIHFVRYKKAIYYLRESVERYKETGDGRIQLSKTKSRQHPKVVSFKEYLNNKSSAVEKTGGLIDAGTFSSEIGKLNKRSYEDLMEG